MNKISVFEKMFSSEMTEHRNGMKGVVLPKIKWCQAFKQSDTL